MTRKKVVKSFLSTPLERRGLKSRLYALTPIPGWLPPEVLVGLGLLMSALSAFSFSLSGKGYWGLIGAFFAILYWICDNLDGEHARSTGQCRNGGELLDHFADPLSVSLLAVGVGISVDALWMGLLAALVVYANAYLVILRASITDVLTLPHFGNLEAVAMAAILGLLSTILIVFFDAANLSEKIRFYGLIIAAGVAFFQLVFQVIFSVNYVNRDSFSSRLDCNPWRLNE